MQPVACFITINKPITFCRNRYVAAYPPPVIRTHIARNVPVLNIYLRIAIVIQFDPTVGKINKLVHQAIDVALHKLVYPNLCAACQRGKQKKKKKEKRFESPHDINRIGYIKGLNYKTIFREVVVLLFEICTI